MMPTFLEQTRYRNTVDSTGPFQFAFKTNLGMFDFLNERPKRLSVFNTFMEGQRLGRIPWFEYYPVESSLYDGLISDDAVLIVDVGGGRGHDLEAFKGVFPRQRGRVIVQDLPNTINEIDYLAPGVESMRFDFFTPQPIKGLITSRGIYKIADRFRIQVPGRTTSATSSMTVSCFKILLPERTVKQTTSHE